MEIGSVGYLNHKYFRCKCGKLRGMGNYGKTCKKCCTDVHYDCFSNKSKAIDKLELAYKNIDNLDKKYSGEEVTFKLLKCLITEAIEYLDADEE